MTVGPVNRVPRARDDCRRVADRRVPVRLRHHRVQRRRVDRWISLLAIFAAVAILTVAMTLMPTRIVMAERRVASS